MDTSIRSNCRKVIYMLREIGRVAARVPYTMFGKNTPYMWSAQPPLADADTVENVPNILCRLKLTVRSLTGRTDQHHVQAVTVCTVEREHTDHDCFNATPGISSQRHCALELHTTIRRTATVR